MDLELKWRDLTWFEVLGRATATHEEALETAIPEYCPDMNRIVDATGQLQIRDREITGGAVMVSGMVSVRVLYSSEESSGLRSLAARRRAAISPRAACCARRDGCC